MNFAPTIMASIEIANKDTNAVSNRTWVRHTRPVSNVTVADAIASARLRARPMGLRATQAVEAALDAATRLEAAQAAAPQTGYGAPGVRLATERWWAAQGDVPPAMREAVRSLVVAEGNTFGVVSVYRNLVALARQAQRG